MEIASALVISSLISAAAAAGTTAYNSYAAQQANDTSFAQSRDMAEWQAKELPTLKVEGLRKAGLNPILGYDSLGSASVPVFNAQAGQAGNFGQIAQVLSKLPEVQSADALRKNQMENNTTATEAQAASLLNSMKNNDAQTASNIAEAQSRIALNNARTMETMGDTNGAQALKSMRDSITNFYNWSTKPQWSTGIGKNFVTWREDPVESIATMMKDVSGWTSSLSKWFNGLFPKNESSASGGKPELPTDSVLPNLMQGRLPNGEKVDLDEVIEKVVPDDKKASWQIFKEMILPYLWKHRNGGKK